MIQTLEPLKVLYLSDILFKKMKLTKWNNYLFYCFILLAHCHAS